MSLNVNQAQNLYSQSNINNVNFKSINNDKTYLTDIQTNNLERTPESDTLDVSQNNASRREEGSGVYHYAVYVAEFVNTVKSDDGALLCAVLCRSLLHGEIYHQHHSEAGADGGAGGKCGKSHAECAHCAMLGS